MILGNEQFQEVENPDERAKLLKAIEVDKAKIRALHGTAVLSRYPIRDVKAQPFDHQGYDWYHGEQNIVKLESGKRKAATLVGEKLGREVRRGGRTSLIVTLDVPSVKEGQVTIVATHLENRTDPKERRVQMEELLDRGMAIRRIAGDEKRGSEGRPRPGTQTVASKWGTGFWTNRGHQVRNGEGRFWHWHGASKMRRMILRSRRERGVIEGGLFDALEEFRFNDETALDFRCQESYKQRYRGNVSQL
jgi:hypothetical protein